jgi:hypothetical protein
MPSHEDTLRQQYTTLLSAFSAAFPNVTPPAPTWWLLWLGKYDVGDIHIAIETLGRHELKGRFTQDSTGRAISSLLRQAALRKAVLS